MKKTVLISVLVSFLTVGVIRPASAGLTIDFGQIAAFVSDWAGKINEETKKISEFANKNAKLDRWGSEINGFKKSASKYSEKYLKDLLGKKVATKQQTKVEEGTKGKNLEELKVEMESYASAVKNEYQMKYDIVSKECDETEKQLQIKRDEYEVAKVRMIFARDRYLSLKDSGADIDTVSKAYDEYSEADIEFEEASAALRELENKLKSVKEKRAELELELLKVGTPSDPVYQAMKNRVLAMQLEEDQDTFVEGDVSADRETDWANNENLMDNFSVSEEDYRKFLERYFYDPTTIQGAGQQKYQSHIDRVMRERRFLAVNTAAHLLQVATTVRREIPVREAAVLDYFEISKKGSGELEAVVGYTNTRLENIKTLFLYARLLSAKLEYLAANDLLKGDPRKISAGVSYGRDFDLQKYILTKEELERIIKEAADTSVFDSLMDAGNE